MKKSFFLIIMFASLFSYYQETRASSLPSETVVNEKPELLLYYLPWCPYCQQVFDYLNKIHKTVPSESLQKNPQAREDLKKIGGKMQVPCLVINDYALYESTLIIKWLSENKQYLDPA